VIRCLVARAGFLEKKRKAQRKFQLTEGETVNSRKKSGWAKPLQGKKNWKEP